jgi:alpha-ketoglutarate-dependent taurine dioxygenase
MKVSKIPGLGRFGVYIDDVDFNTITDEEWMEIGKLHLEKLVTVVRNTNLTKEKQIEFIDRFGSSRFGTKNYFIGKYNRPWDYITAMALEDSKEIDALDKIIIKSCISAQEQTSIGKDITRVQGGYDENGNPLGMFAEGELLWHSNESGTLTFTPGVALLAAKNVIGSATGFVTTVDYYESVSDSFRRELDDMILIHRFTPGKICPGLNPQQDLIMNLNMCPHDGKEIPMVITSPGGIRGLHYSINTVWDIKGATQKESIEIFDRINKELFVDEYTYDHWYKNDGDLMLFDNSITLHRRLGNIKDRLCYRIQHDYTHLQDSVWYPYSQPDIAKQYKKEIRRFIKTTGVSDFKLPPRSLADFIPFLDR